MAELGVNEPADRTENEPCEHGDKPESWWDFKASHWVTAILTAALVYVGDLQYSVYTRQAGIMGTQAQIASSQARPWVGLSNVLIGSINRGAKLSLSAQIKNSGGTPALKMTVCAASDTPNAGQVDIDGIRNMLKRLDGCPNQTMFFLLPNAEIGMDVSRDAAHMTQTVVDDVLADKATFAVFGRINYAAASDGSDHWTTFCTLYLRASNSFSACPIGNETDSESRSINHVVARGSAIAASPNNWTDPITIFTALLVVVGALQAFVYLKQKSIMQRSLSAHRRPQFLIRELLQLGNASGNKLTIQCAIVNAGDDEGTIVESYFDVQVKILSQWRPKRAKDGENPIGPLSLASGGRAYWDLVCNLDEAALLGLAHAESEIQKRESAIGPSVQVQPPVPTVCLHGYIVYTDKLCVRRRTAIVRILDMRNQRFYRIDEPDYEYAD